ncbi:MAG: ATP synthase subunit I [Thermodesulfobacteriota bacterium]
MLPVDLDWKAAYREIRLINWITLLVFSLLSIVFFDPASTAGIIFGGLIIIANLGLLQHTIRRAFAGDGTMTRSRWSVVLKYFFRLLALAAVLFALVAWEWVNPVGLAVGLSTLFISIVGFGIKRACKIYIREAV